MRKLLSLDRLRSQQVAAVRGTFRHVLVRDGRVLVGVPHDWTGHDDDVRHEIDGRTYADVSSALDYLVTTDDPCDVGLVKKMLEFEPATHAEWYRAA